MATYLDGGYAHRQRRLGRIRNQCLEPEWVRPPGLVPWPSACNGPVILHPDKQYSTAAVRQADHCLNQVAVIQRCTTFTLELHLIRLSVGDAAGDALGQGSPEPDRAFMVNPSPTYRRIYSHDTKGLVGVHDIYRRARIYG